MRLVITSVKYADFLAVTLPAWKTFVPYAGALCVATSPEDEDTQRVAREHDVQCFMTDAWTRTDPTCHQGGEPTFNLALGLDETLGLAGGVVPPPALGEVVGHVSADCVPFGTCDLSDLRFDTVYAWWRHECLQPKHLADHQRGKRPLSQFPRLKNTAGAPIGYCQIFRHQPGRRFGSYPTAGKFDTHFTATFPRSEMWTDGYLLHLGPINVRENWGGRVVPTWGAA